MRWALAVMGLVASLGAQTVALHAGWAVQSSAAVSAAPEAISVAGFSTAGWLSTSVPSTAFNAQVAHHLFPDPDVAMNLREVPGVTYKIGANFSHEEIADDSPYRVPWWFRTEFTVPAGWGKRTVWLDFRGINYRANVWLNGHQLADSGQMAGTFRRFEYDASAWVRRDGANALAVEVFPPGIHDLAITFVDWNPMPPDKEMGIWGKVLLSASGPVAIRDPFVATTLDDGNAVAHLTVSARLINATDTPQTGVLRGHIGARLFAQSVHLEAHETKEVLFPVLDLAHPQLWWPYQMGTPAMQELDLAFVQGGVTSDRVALPFGISQITSEITAGGGLQFLVNGRKVLIRGGGWTPDMLLRDGPARWADDFAYVKGMNLNAVRLEGKLMDDEFFNLADRNGILVLAGWCCCDHWEEWPQWKDDEKGVATASLQDQITRLRTHPSLLAWLNGSDNPPPAPIEQAYLDIEHAARWPKPIVSSASGKKTTVTGASGVKMTGPYDFVPPVYWLQETKEGGAAGFNTETSPGAAIPPIESLRKFIPAEHLWPISDPENAKFWNYHAGGGQFLNLDRYNGALAARYGAATSLEDYDWKAQAMAYEGERAMFESFGRNRGTATGVIQWMLNNGWPSLIWHLYDYYLTPGAGYFAAKLANEPVHVQYSDFDREVTVVNGTDRPRDGVVARARVYGLDGRPLAAEQRRVLTLDANSVSDAFEVPAVERDQAYFLRLSLTGASGTTISTNTYWLSPKADVLNEKSGTWFYMPESSYADFSALSSLPAVSLKATATYGVSGSDDLATVTVSNPTANVAFFVRLRVLKGKSGDEVLPVRWSGNYVTLLPGESRILTARYAATDLGAATPTLAVDGWNVRP